MKKRFYEIGQNAIVYGLGNVAQQLIGFLLLPVYTSHLDPEEYGRLALIATLSTLLSVFLGMGITTSIFKHFFKEKTTEGRRLIISSSFFWLLGLGILTVFSIFLSSATIADALLGSTDYTVHIQLMAVTLVLTQLQIIPFGVLRAEKKPRQYTFLTLSNFVLSIGLNIVFVVSMGLGILGVLWAGLISISVFVLIGLYLCRHMIRLTFSWPVVKSMLHYGFPLVPSSISLYVLNQSDRWFLQHYSTMQEVGIYALGYKIGSVINLVMIQPIQLIWMPVVYEMENQTDAKLLYQRMLTYILMIGCWIGLGIISFSKELLLFMTAPKYHVAYVVIPWVVLAYIMYGAYFVVVIGIFLKDKTSYTIWIVGLAGVSNILFNFLLIPSFGSLGAAQSTLISFIVLFCVAWWINHRVYPLQYEWGRIVKIVIVFLVLMSAGRYMTGGFVPVIIKSLFMLGYWILLLTLRFYKKEELFWVKDSVRRMLSGRSKILD